MRPTSDPASGSDMQIVAVAAPDSSAGTQSARVSSSAHSVSRRAAARLPPGAIMKAGEARSKSWFTATNSVSGMPCPPSSSSCSSPIQPPSAKAR